MPISNEKHSNILESQDFGIDSEESPRQVACLNMAQFPRRGYLQGPTPIEELKNLSKFLGGDVNIFVKRDDLLPGASGGNKTRKLDFCIAEALAEGADTIVTCGAVQSNHCRLTASWCAKEEIDCHLVLEERVKGSYKEDGSGNHFLFQLLGVKSIRVVPGGSNMVQEMESTAAELRALGKKPFVIAGGASTPTGALGYAECAQEIVTQLSKSSLRIDHIVLASGSSGTHAGMVAGIAGLETSIKIHGINTSRPREAQESLVFGLAEKTALLLGVEVSKDLVRCYDDYVGEGYSLSTEGMIEAVKLFARKEGILLDPVYTGKTAAGLIGLIRSGAFEKGANVLFLHTGGSPALYAYMDAFRGETM